MPRTKKNNLSFGNSKSYISLLYGALTVFIIFLVIIFGLKFFEISKNGQITENAARTSAEQGGLSTYTVRQGDSLWTIAETQYSNGDRWVEIAKTNNISNPGEIEPGQKLVLSSVKIDVPQKTESSESASVEEVEDSQAMTTAPSKDKISGGKYVVRRGDDLWDIAVRAYGDGYRWVEIAKANNLANPNIIHAGNNFVIPR